MSDFRLSCGDYEAKIRKSGAGLDSLTFKGRNLIEPFELNQPERYRGDVLAPWPNRIRDGKYVFEGTKFQLELTEPSRSNALHGLVNRIPWSPEYLDTKKVKLSYELNKPQYYPATLNFQIQYEICVSGLLIELEVKNVGKISGPLGVSIHPYLIADSDSRVDEWVLKMPSSRYFRVDEQRLLPLEIATTPSNLDFRNFQKIGNSFIDHAFEIDAAIADQEIRVLAPSGNGVGMSYSKNLTWIQIHTADRDGGVDSRRCLAVEPMSCPPDAFNSGLNLVKIAPNQLEKWSWKIFAL